METFFKFKKKLYGGVWEIESDMPYQEYSSYDVHQSPRTLSITGPTKPGKCYLTCSIPLKRVIFSDIMLTFAMSLMIFACLNLQH